jgi:hypothetical protein
MIQKLKNGKYRARYDYGHNSYYKWLLRQVKKIEKDIASLREELEEDEGDTRAIKTLLNQLADVNYDIDLMEAEFGSPVNIKTRRSFNSRHKWQAEQAEELFIQAFDYEKEGLEVPRKLEKQIADLQEAPKREDYLEELSYQYASVAGFHEEVLENFDYELYLSQADVNMEWLSQFNIRSTEVKNKAKGFCCNIDNLTLKNKKYIFTGSFVSFTVCEGYVNALATMAKEEKVDGIICAGPWIKYIFLHKTGRSQKILDCVKKLCSEVPVYAIRSNKESAEMIPRLKELGIQFVRGIEDEKNLFVNHKFGNQSQKDQLTRWRDYDKNKNLFVPTTYPAFEPKLKMDQVRYIVGSGCSSYMTPSARIWAHAYDSQSLNSEKYDRIGGHVLRFDENSEVFPTTFHYNEKHKAILSCGNAYMKTKKEKGKIHLLVSDAHMLGIDKKGYSALLQFIVKNRDDIASLIFNGDFFSNSILSHWHERDIKKQIDMKQLHKSFLHEVAITRQLIKEITEYTTDNGRRNIRKVYKMGNHEINSFKKLKAKPLIHFLDNMLDLDPLLELSKQGFEIITGKKPYYVNDVPILHGHEMSRLQAMRILGGKVTVGHWHRGTIDNLGTILPTLEDSSDVDFLSYWKNAWTAGWGIITEYKKQTEKTEIILLNDNKFFNLEKVVKAKSMGNFELPKEITVTYSLEE